MNIAEEQCKWVMETFKSDSTNKLDVPSTRAIELLDSSLVDCDWFINGHRLITARDRIDNRFFGIYRNSFSKQKTTVNEIGKITLNLVSNN